MKQSLLSFCLLGLAFPSAGYYEDPVIRTDDESVRAIVLPTRFAYAFTNTAQAIAVTLKDAEVVNRTLVVAGGGAGGMAVAGGGGGGGVLRDSKVRSLGAGDEIGVAVGAGGVAADTTDGLTKGGNSVLTIGGETVTTYGGGVGLGWGQTSGEPQKGGSGGGGTMKRAGGTGTSGQGYAGGSSSSLLGSCGGGGAGEAGHAYDSTLGGVGGAGVVDDITGEDCVYGSGGGGGGGTNGSGRFVSGKGGVNAGDGGEDALPGYGGGGGGGRTGGSPYVHGAGGSGAVVLGFAPTSEGILTLASNMDVPDASYPGLSVGSFLTKTNLTVSAVDSSVADIKVKFVCRGYSIETYDAQLETWSAPQEFSTKSYTFADVAGKCVRLTWRWEKTLDVDRVYQDRALMASAPFRKTKVADGDYAYVFTDTSDRVSVLLKADAQVPSALVVAGGGAGGSGLGAGGGGGGVIATNLNLSLGAADVFTLRVGRGGQGSSSAGAVTSGENSDLAIGGESFVAVGGGRGGCWATDYQTGIKGGSGGGGTMNRGGGSGTNGQGCSGAGHYDARPGGGGGATEAGSQATASAGGRGGQGCESTITGERRVYGSGGGGGSGSNSVVTSPIVAGEGGENAGAGGGGSGVDGFGGGGGGGTSSGVAGGNGGSGAVVLRICPDLPPVGVVLIFR